MPQKERIVCLSIAVSFRESTFLKDFGNFPIVPKKFPNKNNWLVVKKHFFVNPSRINRDPNEIHPPWNKHSPWNLVVGRLLFFGKVPFSGTNCLQLLPSLTGNKSTEIFSRKILHCRPGDFKELSAEQIQALKNEVWNKGVFKTWISYGRTKLGVEEGTFLFDKLNWTNRPPGQ